MKPGLVAVLKIGLAPRLDHHRYAGIYDHVARSGQLSDLRAAGIIVPVCVTDEQNLRVSLEFLPLTRHLYQTAGKGGA